MLVEDDQDDQGFFLDALEQIKDVNLFGIADNGKIAIEKLQASPILPTMIFMDINMPLMNGLDCLRKIMKDPVMNTIPVIMLSSDIHYKEQTHALGAAGFIRKPANVPALQLELVHILLKLTKKSLLNYTHNQSTMTAKKKRAKIPSKNARTATEQNDPDRQNREAVMHADTTQPWTESQKEKK